MLHELLSQRFEFIQSDVVLHSCITTSDWITSKLCDFHDYPQIRVILFMRVLYDCSGRAIALLPALVAVLASVSVLAKCYSFTSFLYDGQGEIR